MSEQQRWCACVTGVATAGERLFQFNEDIIDIMQCSLFPPQSRQSCYVTATKRLINEIENFSLPLDWAVEDYDEIHPDNRMMIGMNSCPVPYDHNKITDKLDLAQGRLRDALHLIEKTTDPIPNVDLAQFKTHLGGASRQLGEAKAKLLVPYFKCGE